MASSFNGDLFGYYNYSNDLLVSYKNDQGTTTDYFYNQDTINMKSYGVSASNRININWIMKNENLIDMLAIVNFTSFKDSSKSSFKIANSLIVSRYNYSWVGPNANIIDSFIYVYNSDNTLKEYKGNLYNELYEYYDISDSINVSNDLNILTKYFKLKTNFKLVKKKTTVSSSSGSILSTLDYRYIQDENKRVTMRIMNNTDTTRYQYLCE